MDPGKAVAIIQNEPDWFDMLLVTNLRNDVTVFGEKPMLNIGQNKELEMMEQTLNSAARDGVKVFAKMAKGTEGAIDTAVFDMIKERVANELIRCAKLYAEMQNFLFVI